MIVLDLVAKIERILEVSTRKTNMAAQNDGMVIIWKGVQIQFNAIQFLCDGI